MAEVPFNQGSPPVPAGPARLPEDEVCVHGTALDVHCCGEGGLPYPGCHSGFLFDIKACRCSDVLVLDDPAAPDSADPEVRARMQGWYVRAFKRRPDLEEPFNKLTPAQAELLDLLAEECAEVIQAVSKIKRHGYGSGNPQAVHEGDNRADLERELAHLQAAQELLFQAGDLRYVNIPTYRQEKLQHVWKYLHHQEALYKASLRKKPPPHLGGPRAVLCWKCGQAASRGENCEGCGAYNSEGK